MESKTKSVDLSVRASLALIQGILVAMCLPMFYFVFPAYVQTSPALFLFFIIPMIAFLTSSVINWSLQYLYCSKVQASNILLASSYSPAFVVGFSGLVYLFPFLRLPVSQLFPASPSDTPQDTEITQEIWGYSFYLLWAGLYSQTLALGMVSACA
jgi:hypothetical protein